MEKYGKTHNLFKRNLETHKLNKDIWKYEEFEYLKDCEWIGTEKIDGTNMRMLFNAPKPLTAKQSRDEESLAKYTGKFEVRGRSNSAQISFELEKHMHELFPSEEFMLEYGSIYGLPYETICFYGEGYGPGIQKGGYYADKKSFVLFDIKIGHNWLPFDQVVEIGKDLGIPVVPTILSGTLDDLILVVETGFWSILAKEKHLAEGLVVFPYISLNNRWGERIRAKIKGVDYE